MFRQKTPAPLVVTNTSQTAGTQISTTTSSTSPIPSGEGALLLSASPYADIERIIGDGGKSFPLPEDPSTPIRLDLPPGRYTVTLRANDVKKDIAVDIEAGKRTPQRVDMSKVDIESLAKEMNQP